jgi:hypothetical protein
MVFSVPEFTDPCRLKKLKLFEVLLNVNALPLDVLIETVLYVPEDAVGSPRNMFAMVAEEFRFTVTSLVKFRFKVATSAVVLPG